MSPDSSLHLTAVYATVSGKIYEDGLSCAGRFLKRLGIISKLGLRYGGVGTEQLCAHGWGECADGFKGGTPQAWDKPGCECQ